MTPPQLMDAADRLWDAAYELDDLRGDRAASEWCAVQVRRLMREGRAEDPEAVLTIARALEGRLQRERRGAA